jgi:hypothetical protein
MKSMKSDINKLLFLAAMLAVAACSDPESPTPDTSGKGTPSKAFFVMSNASPDAPSLDFYINNAITGPSVAANASQPTYTAISIPSNGIVANTNLKAKATTGIIGGALDNADVIYRSTNNGANNFAAADSGYYTFIVTDTITRPKPLRTLNAKNFGDTTYFNPLTGQYISVVERAALPPAQKAKTKAIGTVPLGSSDPGGPRFIVITDQLPLPSTTRFPKPAANKVAVRFIHASPDAGTATAKAGATPITVGQFTFPMLFPAFSPSVGSRSITQGFQIIDAGTLDLTANIGVTEVARLNAQPLTGGGIYTIVLSGKRGKNSPLTLSLIKNK